MFNSKKMYLILVLLLCLVLVTGCSSTDDEDNLDRNVAGTDDVGVETEVGGTLAEVDVEEQVILDQEGLIITVKSLELDDVFGPSLKVLVENNSDQSITAQIRESSINGIMLEPMFSCEVGVGKKANDTITFMESELEQAGITTIKDIEFKVHVFDTESWDGIFDSEVIEITTTADPSYVQAYDDSGIVVMEDQDIRIVMKRVSSADSFWGADVYMYIENNSETDATIQVRDVSINGFMIDPSFSSDVLAGKKAYDSITFFESDLLDNDIEAIDDMELSFHIFTMSGWDTILDSPSVSVSFE